MESSMNVPQIAELKSPLQYSSNLYFRKYWVQDVTNAGVKRGSTPKTRPSRDKRAWPVLETIVCHRYPTLGVKEDDE